MHIWKAVILNLRIVIAIYFTRKRKMQTIFMYYQYSDKYTQISTYFLNNRSIKIYIQVFCFHSLYSFNYIIFYLHSSPIYNTVKVADNSRKELLCFENTIPFLEESYSITYPNTVLCKRDYFPWGQIVATDFRFCKDTLQLICYHFLHFELSPEWRYGE